MNANVKKKRLVGQRLRRGVYLLPSLFTAGNITLGFLAIITSLPGPAQDFPRAALMIFFAGVLDGLDGRIARLTGTDSDFGKELDSLADVLAFGAAPALLSYLWALQPLGRLGWILPLFFLFCTAVRLARFNVQTKSTSSRYFVGLPSPPAAGAIAGLMLIAYEPHALALGLKQEWLMSAMPFALVIVGSLMVTTFRYPSLKMAKLDKRMSYRVYLPVAIFFIVLMLYPETLFPLVAFLYLIYGPLTWCFGRLRRRSPEPAE
jgi:CDP-diacylglycerol--serine O-phosphatidyltransferase